MRSFITTVPAGVVLGASLCLLASCSSGPSTGEVPEHPDFSGVWILNNDLSEDPSDQDRPSEPPQGGPGGRAAASRGRFSAETGTILPPLAFRITESDTTLTFAGVDGRRRILFQDGRKVVRPVEGLGNVTISSRWKGNKFVVERALEGGVKIAEEYRLSDDGLQLRVKVKISAGRNFEFLRVYDAGDENR